MGDWSISVKFGQLLLIWTELTHSLNRVKTYSCSLRLVLVLAIGLCISIVFSSSSSLSFFVYVRKSTNRVYFFAIALSNLKRRRFNDLFRTTGCLWLKLLANVTHTHALTTRLNEGVWDCIVADVPYTNRVDKLSHWLIQKGSTFPNSGME